MYSECLFCKIINKKITSTFVFENEYSIVIKDLYPKAKIHLLIIPKKHIDNVKKIEQKDATLISDLFFTAQTLSKIIPDASDFKLVINNGQNAGQEIFHLHVHFLAAISSSN